MKRDPTIPAARRTSRCRFACLAAKLAVVLGSPILPLQALAGYTSTGDNYLQTTTWVGYQSTGNLVINEDHDFNTASLIVGQQAGGNGTVTVSGLGTSLTLSDNLNMGNAGRATVNLELGATMTTNKSVYVGVNGTGSLNIRSGAVLTSNGTSAYPTASIISIGSTTGASSVTVDGAGSQWIIPNMGIGVGASATGTAALTVTNGGKISTTGMAVLTGGSLLVSGLDPLTQAAATLDMTGSFRIDNSGPAAAVVSAGGIVNARGNSSIGSYQGLQGAMTVTGAGSQVNVVGAMTLAASSGNGALTVADGGLFSVSATGSALGTGNGTLTVGAIPSSSNPGTPSGVATLYIGTGGVAGKLNVREVYGFIYTNDAVPPADSTVIFNHNEAAYEFTNSVGAGILINGGTKVKQVSGTTIFTAASDYKGGTQITGGTLLVNNTTGSGTGTGAVTVSGTGTLGGSGRVTGNITVESGGATHPGNSKIFSGANLEYKTGSTAKFTLGAPVSLGESPVAGQDYDQIALTGNLKVGTGTTLELQLTASTMAYFHDLDGTDPEANYFLFNLDSSSVLGQFDFLNVMLDGTTYTQSILDGRATFADLGITVDIGYTGNTATNSLLGGNDVTVQVSAVPEPLTGCLLLVGGAGALFVRRRKSLIGV